MKKAIWKMKRNSIVRQATKSVAKDFRPLIKSAIIRPSNIQHIRDSTADFQTQKESILTLGDAISHLSASSYTIPDARNLLLGICRGSVKVHNCDQALTIAKQYYKMLNLDSDSRLVTALLLCSMDIGDEKFAFKIAELGIADAACQNQIIDMVQAIIESNRTQLEDEETKLNTQKTKKPNDTGALCRRCDSFATVASMFAFCFWGIGWRPPWK